jgi:hypothetical protein
MRISKSGVEIEDLDIPCVLLITTKSPDKYLLIDRETGELYQGLKPRQGYAWDKVAKLDESEIEKLEQNLRS